MFVAFRVESILKMTRHSCAPLLMRCFRRTTNSFFSHFRSLNGNIFIQSESKISGNCSPIPPFSDHNHRHHLADTQNKKKCKSNFSALFWFGTSEKGGIGSSSTKHTISNHDQNTGAVLAFSVLRFHIHKRSHSIAMPNSLGCSHSC